MNLPPVQYTIGAAVDAYFVADDGRIARSDTLLLEAVAVGHWANYGFPMSDPQGVGLFGLAFPAIPAGVYSRYIRERAGGSPAASDPSVGADGPWTWNGAAIVFTPPSASPGECTVYDREWLPTGMPAAGRTVTAYVVVPFQFSGGNTESGPATATADADGNWSLALPRGASAVFSIPEAGIRALVEVPAAGSATLRSLL